MGVAPRVTPIKPETMLSSRRLTSTRTTRTSGALGLPSVLLLAGSFSVSAAVAGGCSNGADQNTGAGVSAIVFIKRAHTHVDDKGVTTIDVANGNGQVLDYQRYVP